MICIICYTNHGKNYICEISKCNYNMCDNCYKKWNNKYCIICRKKKNYLLYNYDEIGYESNFNNIISNMFEDYNILRVNNIFNYAFFNIENEFVLIIINLILIPLMLFINFYIICILICKYTCLITYNYIITTHFYLFITHSIYHHIFRNEVLLFIIECSLTLKHLCLIILHYLKTLTIEY